MSNNSGGCSAPPFLGVVGSGHGCGVNVGPRVNRADFTGTRRSTASNGTSSSTAPASWSPRSSAEPTCRTGPHSPSCYARPNGSRRASVTCGSTQATPARPSPPPPTRPVPGVDVVCGPKPSRGFVVQPRRWVVTRTNGWVNHCRRIDRHYETTLQAHEGFVDLSQIVLLLPQTRPQPVVRHALANSADSGDQRQVEWGHPTRR